MINNTKSFMKILNTIESSIDPSDVSNSAASK